jgi:hypothetical protein
LSSSFGLFFLIDRYFSDTVQPVRRNGLVPAWLPLASGRGWCVVGGGLVRVVA